MSEAKTGRPSRGSGDKVSGGSTRTPVGSVLTVTDLEVLSAFLLPALQETILGENLSANLDEGTCAVRCTCVEYRRSTLAKLGK